MVIPHYMGKSKEIEIGENENYSNYKDIRRNDSFSSLSSFQDVPLLMPQEAEGPDTVKIEPKLNGFNALNDLHGQPSRLSRSPFFFRKSKIEPLTPDMPMRGFVDDLDALDLQSELSHTRQPSFEFSEKEWWETQERGDQVVSADEVGQVGPRVSCSCQVNFISCIALDFCCYNLQTAILFKYLICGKPGFCLLMYMLLLI